MRSYVRSYWSESESLIESLLTLVARFFVLRQFTWYADGGCVAVLGMVTRTTYRLIDTSYCLLASYLLIYADSFVFYRTYSSSEPWVMLLLSDIDHEITWSFNVIMSYWFEVIWACSKPRFCRSTDEWVAEGWTYPLSLSDKSNARCWVMNVYLEFCINTGDSIKDEDSFLDQRNTTIIRILKLESTNFQPKFQMRLIKFLCAHSLRYESLLFCLVIEWQVDMLQPRALCMFPQDGLFGKNFVGTNHWENLRPKQITKKGYDKWKARK